MRICVFCASSESIDPTHSTLAAAVGTAIAARGWDLVTGGGRVSMMGAVARAARAGGAHTIGIIPDGLMHREDADTDADELLIVSDMRVRKAGMDERADAFLALAGGIGTLEELLEAWTARSLHLHTKPVVVLDPDNVYQHLRALITDLADRGFIRQSALDTLHWTDNIDTALDLCATPA